MKTASIVSALFAVSLAFGGSATAEPAAKTAEPMITPAQSGGGYNPPKPKKGFRYPDCFCTDSKGKRVELGKTVCLQIGSQSFTARCAMSLNNPTWRRVSEGCPSV